MLFKWLHPENSRRFVLGGCILDKMMLMGGMRVKESSNLAFESISKTLKIRASAKRWCHWWCRAFRRNEQGESYGLTLLACGPKLIHKRNRWS
jgi:hypothetical protein